MPEVKPTLLKTFQTAIHPIISQRNREKMYPTAKKKSRREKQPSPTNKLSPP
jgi:hypothetical protein